MLVNLRQIVTHSINNILVKPLQLRRCIKRTDIERQLLRTVKEQLDASQPRLLRLELESPFRRRFSPGGRIGGKVIGDFRGDFVRRDAIASGPCFDDFYIIRSRSVNRRNTRQLAHLSRCYNPHLP